MIQQFQYVGRQGGDKHNPVRRADLPLPADDMPSVTLTINGATTELELRAALKAIEQSAFEFLRGEKASRHDGTPKVAPAAMDETPDAA